MIVLEDLERLKKAKSLLAFSHGSDSTALFYLLLEQKISFDCALVNYKTRESSDEEQKSAKELCAKFNKAFYTLNAPILKGNFESEARKIRRDFFIKICNEKGYNCVIFAHQLNDYFEWFLMGLKRGSGLVNLLGFDESLEAGIDIIRPLKYTPKDEILEFLKLKNIKYYNDSSNNDESYLRNYIRARFSDDFIRFASSGIKKSFKALNEDKANLLEKFIYEKNDIFVFTNSALCLNLADKVCKKLGVVISKNQREIIKDALSKNKEIVISHKIVLSATKELVFISPFKTSIIMPKDFKEKCRIAKIPSKIRPYLFEHKNELKELFYTLKLSHK